MIVSRCAASRLGPWLCDIAVSSSSQAALRSTAASLSSTFSSTQQQPAGSFWSGCSRGFAGKADDAPKTEEPTANADSSGGGVSSSSSSAGPEPGPRPSYFPQIDFTNGMQPFLEKAEVTKAMNGLVFSGWGNLWAGGGPLQPLTDSVVRNFNSLRYALMRPIYNRISEITTQIVSQTVEGAFEVNEFLEGAKSAVHAVYDSIPEGTGALTGMLSQRLVERLDISLKELQLNHQVQLSRISPTITRATIIGLNLWGKDSMALLEPSAADLINVNTCDSWLVLTVALDVSLEVVYRPMQPDSSTSSASDSSTSSAGSSSNSLPEMPPMMMDRRGVWQFARGPLPKGFSNTLHLPWKVTAWW